MQSESSEATTSPSKRKSDKCEAENAEKIEPTKKSEGDDPKPRIVLTFRSEKPGAKSTMKIVSNEEKHEEVSPRRTRNRGTPKWDSDDDALVSPRKDRTKSQPVSENDDASDSSNTNLKRSTRHRSKDISESTVISAARKDNGISEAAISNTPTQRLSRRIKPTAKILANEELRIGLESQNNARLGISSEKSPEEGVRTRRSTRRRSMDRLIDENFGLNLNKTRAAKRGVKQVEEDDVVEVQEVDVHPAKEKKLKHLCGLGLKEKTPDDDEDDDIEVIEERDDEPEVIDGEDEDEDDDDEEELDDETEVINKLLEDDQESQATETSDDDEEYFASEEQQQSEPQRQRRSRRPTPRRRSSRKPAKDWSVDLETESPVPEERVDAVSVVRKRKRSPVAGDAGAEPACPEDETKVIATCFCQVDSNMYPAPGELEEPVFCQAIESVDGVRVGCSHRALGGASLVRAGPRSPYIMACQTHRRLMYNHMCCPACGLFCTQGTFYQCSLGHLFHLECGVPYNDSKQHPGCSHCGFFFYQWQPVNRQTAKVKVDMKTLNKRIYLPDQRIQCTPSYLTFSKLPRSQIQLEPVIPADLLPISQVDVKKLLEEYTQDSTEADDVKDDEDAKLERLCDAIEARETIHQLIPKILCKGMDLNKPLGALQGGTCLHLAARGGLVSATHALHAAGARLHARDATLNTPLLTAIHELCDKQEKKEVKKIFKLAKTLEVIKVQDTKNKIEDTVADTDEAVVLNEISVKSDMADVKELADKKDSTDDKEIISENKEPSSEDNENNPLESEVKVDVKIENVTEVIEEADKFEVKDDILDEDDSDTEMKEKDKDGASEEDLIKVVKYLVAAGCDVNYAGAEGLTALHIGSSNVDVCRALLAAPSIDLDARDHGGWTPLVWRLENDEAEVVKLLLDQGAAADAVDLEGNSAIHWCSLHGAQHCLQLLLEHSPGLHAALNTHTDTPLHVAARQGHYACVVILLARGARTDVENCEGELPVDVSSGDCEAAILLNMKLNRLKLANDRKTTIISHDISNGREEYEVPCVNSCDDETLPSDFVYVTRHVMPTNITIDNTLDTLQGCSCAGSCGTETCACVRLGVRAWWARGARLRHDFPHHEPPMLFDCNHSCACNPKLCTNQHLTRAIKRGSMLVRAQVYREGGARGWGVRPTESVPRGTPVATYCGELLTVADADSRTDDHYMFALDVKPDLLEQCQEKTLLCIDAGRYGSAARFINHSCQPNLAPVRAYTTTRDLRLPTVALHAITDIPAMEPLTFDYGDKFWSVKNKWMKCECGTSECRYPTMAVEEND